MSLKTVQRALALAVIAAGFFASYWLQAESGIEWEGESFRDYVSRLGALGPLVVVGLMAARPFLGIPSGLILFTAGLLFGTLAGTVYGALGGAIGAIGAFAVARTLGRDAIQARLGARVQELDELLARRGAPWLAVYTALPGAVLSPVFFAAGVTRMRFASFAGATASGFVPRAGLFTFLGETAGAPTYGRIAAAVLLLVGVVVFVWAARCKLAAPMAPDR